MNSSEIAEWFAYYNLEPFGARHRDEHFGIIGAILANTNLKKGAKLFNPSDFRVKTELDMEPEQAPDDEAAKEIFKGLKRSQKKRKKNG